MLFRSVGSKDNFGSEMRGLYLIQEACNIVGYNFHPALKENKWRTVEEMVQYYQDEIDIYIDASSEAGRQNGLLEAAACSKIIMATKCVGISNELITHGENGLLIDRSVDSIIQAFKHPNIEQFGKRIRKVIEDEWSWTHHATIFSDVFNKL